jgi:hypothetical protein
MALVIVTLTAAVAFGDTPPPYTPVAARLAEVEAERDEAKNQLDSALHSLDVLARRASWFKDRGEG